MKGLEIAALLAGSALVLASAPVFAASHTGKIALYHLNSDVAGRGVCVQTLPAMPNTWACLWKNNPLYSEISALLLAGYVNNRTCTITWNTADPNGWNLIAIAECRK